MQTVSLRRFTLIILRRFTLSSMSLISYLSFLLFSHSIRADDIDIYRSNSGSSSNSYVMLALDYRQDLSGPFCQDNGPSDRRCANVLNTPATFTFLQALDTIVNGAPNGAPNGDANGDGLRDNAALMANFEASKLQALIAVARTVFENLNGVNVGLMMPNNDGGGTILRGYREFVENDSNNAKQELIDILLSIPMPRTGNDAHESQPKEMHYEWFSYINGGPVRYGNQTARNFGGTNSPGPDTSIFLGSNYRSPFTARPEDFECSNFYEVYITSGNETGSDSDLSGEIENAMNANAAANYESMVDYMANNDLLTQTSGVQSLKKWFIHLGSNSNSTTANIKAARWADAAGTRSDFVTLTSEAAELVQIQRTLRNAFSHAVPTSATLVSSAVPANVFNFAQPLDSFFVALFEPGDNERWAGNVKKFKLIDNDNNPGFDNIIDAIGRPAFDTTDGKIVNDALSFWTSASALPPPNLDLGEVTGKDGRTVTRGGVGQKIPGLLTDAIGIENGAGTRQVYVESSNGTPPTAFNANPAVGTELQSLLGASTTQEAIDLIAWARGIDVDNEDNDNSTVDARPWILGAPLHSRPLPINYGAVAGYSKSNPNIRIFFGTNEGFFHVIENTSIGGAESGQELFAIIPRELLGNLSHLRTNNGTHDLPYGLDGEPVALVVDQNRDGNITDTDKVHVYTGMRRGGKSYYAFDASNPSAVPQILWKITKTQNGDFDELGYTFSAPSVVKIRYENTARDVLIFAGGFDLQKDDSAGSAARGPDSEGNAIYIVDAYTGELIWKVTGASGNFNSNKILYEPLLTHSIPSAVATLDSNSNGIVDRLYVGDTGSVVWRVDLPEGNSPTYRQDNWSITKLGNFWDASGSQDRRFFHPPDIVQTKDALGNYDGILIQTGDRANPTETRDANYLFYIKDRNIFSGVPPTPLPPLQASDGVFSLNNLAETTSCVSSACSVINYSNGWRIKLNGRGEKGLSSPVIVSGKVFFTTYIPAVSSNSCSAPEGDGQLYIVNLADGTASFNGTRGTSIGPGIPPAVTPIGHDTVIIPSRGIINPFAQSASTQPVKPIQVTGPNVFVISWREFGVDLL